MGVGITQGRSQADSTTRLDGVQVGRGVAACLVVLFHAGRMLALPQYVGHAFFITALFRFGSAGVDFFFVLSGFIIFYVHGGDIDRPERLQRYVWRRITRIYPPYWVVTAIVVAVLLAKQDFVSLTIQRFFTSVLLLPDSDDPLLGVGWSLVHEMLFYLVFAIAICSRRAGLLCAAALLLMCGYGFRGITDPPLLKFLTSPYHIEFALGVAAAFAVRSWNGRGAYAAILTGLVAYGLCAWRIDAQVSDPDDPVNRLWFGLASALIVAGVASAELHDRFRAPRWASYLGAASYSIYLVHVLGLEWSARAGFSLAISHRHPLIAATMMAFLAVIAGCCFYEAVERPVLRFAGRRPRLQLKDAAT